MSLPWDKFFWSDYASDPGLKISSFAAQGLWMRMLCIASEHDPRGYVAVNGNGLDARGIARSTGGSLDEIEELLSELESNGVFSKDRRGFIYSRRMISDAKKRRKLVAAGKLGQEIKREKQKEKTGALEGEGKGGLKGDGKAQIPEARVQKKNSIKRTMPEGLALEAFSEGSKCAEIAARWTVDERMAQAEAFKAHHEREGSKFVDWQAAWRTWVLNSERFQQRNGKGQAPASGYLAHVVDRVIPELEKERNDG